MGPATPVRTPNSPSIRAAGRRMRVGERRSSTSRLRTKTPNSHALGPLTRRPAIVWPSWSGWVAASTRHGLAGGPPGDDLLDVDLFPGWHRRSRHEARSATRRRCWASGAADVQHLCLEERRPVALQSEAMLIPLLAPLRSPLAEAFSPGHGGSRRRDGLSRCFRRHAASGPSTEGLREWTDVPPKKAALAALWSDSAVGRPAPRFPCSQARSTGRSVGEVGLPDVRPREGTQARLLVE
jgi:hypothetical protein